MRDEGVRPRYCKKQLDASTQTVPLQCTVSIVCFSLGSRAGAAMSSGGRLGEIGPIRGPDFSSTLACVDHNGADEG